MINWNALLYYLEQHWDVPYEEVYAQLIVTVRYAIFTPLDLVRNASDLLRTSAKSHQVRQWGKKCYEQCKNWANEYYEFQEQCLSNSENKETACKCIFHNVTSLLGDSGELLQEIQSPPFDVEELEGGDSIKIINLLIQKLSVVAQIHSELEVQDFSWLQQYIANENKLE